MLVIWFNQSWYVHLGSYIHNKIMFYYVCKNQVLHKLNHRYWANVMGLETSVIDILSVLHYSMVIHTYIATFCTIQVFSICICMTSHTGTPVWITHTYRCGNPHMGVGQPYTFGQGSVNLKFRIYSYWCMWHRLHKLTELHQVCIYFLTEASSSCLIDTSSRVFLQLPI